jgi:recombinational DNA repair protein RecR
VPNTTYLDCTQRQPWNFCLKLSLAQSNIIVIVKEPKETQNVGALTLLSMYFGRYHTQRHQWSKLDMIAINSQHIKRLESNVGFVQNIDSDSQKHRI